MSSESDVTHSTSSLLLRDSKLMMSGLLTTSDDRSASTIRAPRQAGNQLSVRIPRMTITTRMENVGVLSPNLWSFGPPVIAMNAKKATKTPLNVVNVGQESGLYRLLQYIAHTMMMATTMLDKAM